MEVVLLYKIIWKLFSLKMEELDHQAVLSAKMSENTGKQKLRTC